MKRLTLVGVGCSFLFVNIQALADDVVTNIMSPIVSYQVPEDLSSQALTNGGISGPIVSYQYFEWPGDDVLHLQSSPWASYYYQFLDAPPLVIVPTNRTPTVPEVTPTVVFPGAYPWQLKTFVNGVLTTNAPPDPNRMTIVLTHGWNASPDDPNGWVRNMASEISLNVAGSPNILIWDWRHAAAADVCDSGQFVAAARQTPDQGFALGQALLSELGTTYSNRIHFIGHSLGALVNGHAAIWVHNRGFAPTNTHMTLFDEAEVGTDLGCVELLKTVLFNQWNPLVPKPYYYRPLPPKFGWADNYITAFGLLHPDAHNVILTNGFPASAASLSGLKSQLTDFHGYPCAWYAETVITDGSAMGHRWSFERNGFAGAPSTNTVFLQSFNGSQWNLAQTNYVGGSNYLDGRFQKYRDALAYAITHRAPDTVQANGAVTGEMLATGPANAFDLFIISLLTRPGTPAPKFPQLGPHPNDAGGGNVGAYAWLPLPIPADAVSMSFDFKIEGDWQDDSLAAALNGTNVLLLAASQVETNVTLNSGLVDVTLYAGQTNEFFVGIVGGTSTNALLTLQNVVFYTAAPPSLQAEASGNDLKVSWPLTAVNFNLEATSKLAATNSWTGVTNVPAVVDLQNTVTNPISSGARFYRLKK
jgi:hypothetical protein